MKHLHCDYMHTPTLEDVAASPPHKLFKARLLLREATAYFELAAIAKKRGWRFVSHKYAFQARVLQAHADFLNRF